MSGSLKQSHSGTTQEASSLEPLLIHAITNQVEQWMPGITGGILQSCAPRGTGCGLPNIHWPNYLKRPTNMYTPEGRECGPVCSLVTPSHSKCAWHVACLIITCWITKWVKIIASSVLEDSTGYKTQAHIVSHLVSTIDLWAGLLLLFHSEEKKSCWPKLLPKVAQLEICSFLV